MRGFFRSGQYETFGEKNFHDKKIITAILHIIVKLNVELTKGKEYRCLFNNEKWTDDESYISSVSFDGTKKTASFCDVFTSSSGDLDKFLN